MIYNLCTNLRLLSFSVISYSDYSSIVNIGLYLQFYVIEATV